jgi:(2Fe-2S) ferredoxin
LNDNLVDAEYVENDTQQETGAVSYNFISSPEAKNFVDQDTQTDEKPEEREIQTQTELMSSKVAITQTSKVELCDEDCQTEEKQQQTREIQVSFKTESTEMGTDPDGDLLE